jgi:imidazolonepropionase
MANWDLLLTNARLATMREGDTPFGTVDEAAVAIHAGTIAWLGPLASLPEGTATNTVDVDGRWITPALVDCHTHLVFAGNRAREFDLRLQGVSYEEIARQGGGIMATVDATRRADEGTLLHGSLARLQALLQDGVATVEIKSGYGLDTGSELKMLRVARQLATISGVSVQTTFLGAHAVPREFAGRKSDYINLLIEEMLPAVATAGLANAVDAYCESIAFSADEVARIFESARSLGLPVKLHADQLSDTGGAELAARFDALSADHLEYSSIAGIEAMAASGTIAVLLPGAFLNLRETRVPPIDAMRAAGVPLAVATDCNPGTSPVCSLQAAMHLATSLFRLTPEEALAGTTRNAAKALGLEDRGILDIGKRADLAIWNIDHPAELSYWLGLNPLHGLLVEGRPASPSP